MSIHSAAITLDRLTFTHPGGDPVLAGLSATFTTGRTGLIGANGTGKSTLFRLIAGELTRLTATNQTSRHTARLDRYRRLGV